MDFHSSPLAFLFSPVKLKLIKFLLKNEALMSEREISRILNVSHMSVNRTMKELSALHLVTPARLGTASVWKTNRRSYAFEVFSKAFKSISNVPTPLEELKAAISQILPLPQVEKITLFGSVAKGKEKPGSDIDLFILVKGEAERRLVEQVLDHLVVLCLDKFGHPLSPYLRTRAEIAARGKLKLDEEIAAGLVLYPLGPAP